LIVVAVGRAEGPTDLGDIQRNAEARADGILAHTAREDCWPNARRKRKPRHRLELVVYEKRRDAACGMFIVAEGITAVIEDGPEQFIILLIEAEHAHLQIVLRRIRVEANLTSAIGRGTMLRGHNRIAERTIVVRPVVMKKRRDCE